MLKENNKGYDIIAKGDLVMLRTHLATDREHYQHWQNQGEWRSLDAPWEKFNAKKKQNKSESKKQTPKNDNTGPHKMAVIATLEKKPLGWVNRYSKDNPLIWFVGIDICEDDYLNRGYGTEALKLWINYLFANSEYHKLCLDTWSFNPRMARVAEKIGFIFEGRQREMQFWQGEWLDLMHYGLLRDEWEESRKK